MARGLQLTLATMTPNVVGEVDMNRTLLTTTAVVAAIALSPAPAVEAGGYAGLHISNLGFGVTVGFGDWGVYTRSWSDPSWSLSFNSALHGYGEWVSVAGLGRAWRPWVEVGWRPYTHGRWVRTVYDWTWVAYEPWGYIPHHYGSWAHCAYGWVWVPGYAYTPANVVWVHAGGYVGWYARPPSGWSHAARGYRHGYRDGYGDGYRDGWRDARFATYVDWHHIASDNLAHHAVPHVTATRTHQAAVGTAPTAHQVRERGGVSMPVRSVSRRAVAVDDREIELVRPAGVVGSIERHAASTIRGSLAPTALERRQPRAGAGGSSHGVSTRRSNAVVEDHTRRSRATRRPGSETGSRSRTGLPSRESPSLPTVGPPSSRRTTATDPLVDRRRAAPDHSGRGHATASGNTPSRGSEIGPRVPRAGHASKPGRITPGTERPQIRARSTELTRSANHSRGTAARSAGPGAEEPSASRSTTRRHARSEPSATARRANPPSDDEKARKRSIPRRR